MASPPRFLASFLTSFQTSFPKPPMSKLRSAMTGLLAAALAFGSSAVPPARAQSVSYSCTLSAGNPVTAAITPSGTIPLINWGTQTQWVAVNDANTACLEFSSRLQSFANPDGSLYVGVGQFNDRKFLCAADTAGNCSGSNFGYLLDLARKDNSQTVLGELFQLDVAQLSGRGDRTFVNVGQLAGVQPAVNYSAPPARPTPHPLLAVNSSRLSSSSGGSSETRSSQSVRYQCQPNAEGNPTTVAHTPRGPIELIVWRSTFWSNSGFTPQLRCQEVTTRFQQQSDAKRLRYISTGTLNSYNVICVSEQSGRCQGGGLLITLEPRDNPNQVLKDLFDLSARARSGGITRSFGATKVVIDLEEFLNESPVTVRK